MWNTLKMMNKKRNAKALFDGLQHLTRRTKSENVINANASSFKRQPRRTYVITRDITFESGVYLIDEFGLLNENGKCTWSRWIHDHGLKDQTLIRDWAYAAQFNLARGIM